jgi:hypothetical protein
MHALTKGTLIFLHMHALVLVTRMDMQGSTPSLVLAQSDKF